MAEWRSNVERILASSPLDQLSIKTVVERLSQETGQDMVPRKKEVRQLVLELMRPAVKKELKREADDGMTHTKTKKPRVHGSGAVKQEQSHKSTAKKEHSVTIKKEKGSFSQDMLLSPPLARLVRAKALPRTQVVKAMWVYIKEHELQDPHDRRYILGDAAFSAVFGTERVHMMGMNKVLGLHLQPATSSASGEYEGVPPSPEEITAGMSSKPKERTRAPTKRKAAAVEKSAGSFHRELVLSPSLAAITGASRMSRPQVVKKLWEYIKQHELQDSRDRRMILCDDLFYAVFQCRKLHMMTMNKYLSKHLGSPDELIEQ